MNGQTDGGVCASVSEMLSMCHHIAIHQYLNKYVNYQKRYNLKFFISVLIQ